MYGYCFYIGTIIFTTCVQVNVLIQFFSLFLHVFFNVLLHWSTLSPFFSPNVNTFSNSLAPPTLNLPLYSTIKPCLQLNFSVYRFYIGTPVQNHKHCCIIPHPLCYSYSYIAQVLSCSLGLFVTYLSSSCSSPYQRHLHSLSQQQISSTSILIFIL